MLDRNKMVEMAKKSNDQDLVDLVHQCIKTYDEKKIKGDNEVAARALEVGIRALARTFRKFPGGIALELETK